MSNIIQIEDFKGFHYIAVNPNCANMLQEYIDKYEDYYLCLLMGDTLKDDFIDDLSNGVPQSQPYIDLYNKFCIEDIIFCRFYHMLYDHDVSKIISEGLKNALLGLVYYHFVTNNQYKNTLVGLVENSNENSKNLSPINVTMYADKRWNNAVQSFNAIAYKIYTEDLYKYPTALEEKYLDII